MLHTVKNSPFSHQALAHALAELQEQDRLLLWQDGVIAVTVAQWQCHLQPLAEQGRLYVMQADLQARGLRHVMGIPITMSDWVDLVAKWGSPHAW
ncbi:sulfurtransferase complex subunit TusB [Oceanisphaera avium]|uniref:Sulfurtransferase TusB n=1 Tax=Oceanisphaera avium TaxID=1903694 RepID=A0A1Y0CY34_9GAMM|nr:sulfurtransferase complex subunit TusB [Oceanisphaera avium]ART80209.1 sulfurtransferase TusB [Oceanisphaera avium]